jgi:phosphoribosyl 1,2-cyclic phosphodiesterase
LGSSSAGNGAAIWNDYGAVMIDLGLGQRYLEPRLDRFGLRFADFSAVVLTHLHADHVCEPTLRRMRRERVPVYVHERAFPVLQCRHLAAREMAEEGTLRSFGEEGMEAEGFEIESFPVSHDSPGGCRGYVFRAKGDDGDKKIAYATDVAYADDPFVERFLDADAFVLESNHDVEMLENSGRPRALIDRIRNTGHLSNEESAAAFGKILDGSRRLPRLAMLAHLSDECNLPELALAAANEAKGARRIDEIDVRAANRFEPTEPFRV